MIFYLKDIESFSPSRKSLFKTAITIPVQDNVIFLKSQPNNIYRNPAFGRSRKSPPNEESKTGAAKLFIANRRSQNRNCANLLQDIF